MFRLHALGSFLVAPLVVLSCSPAVPDGDPTGDPVIDWGDGDGTGDGDGDFVLMPMPNGPPQSDDPRADTLRVREETCDPQTGVCTCLNLALMGSLKSEADDTDTSAFRNWLNGNTDGTAQVTLVDSKPASVDEAWLSRFDVLVLANLNDWNFSDAEKAAVAAWSAEGGGILAITGFESTATESAASSALISFAGMGFAGTTMTDWTAPETGMRVPVYFDGGTEDMRNCLRWTQNNQAGNTTPIQFQPQVGPLEALTFQLDYVGAYIGWSVTAPPDATVLATDPVTKKDMAVAYEYNGAGRILAFGDEWIIFANQWEPKGQPYNTQRDNYNPCYIPPEDSGTAMGSFHSVATVYQTKQFWYNAINWVAPPSECNFVVVDDEVVVR